MASWVRSPQPHPHLHPHQSFNKRLLIQPQSRTFRLSNSHRHLRRRIYCNYDDDATKKQSQPQAPQPTGIKLYSEIERLLTETVRQSQGRWDGSSDWTQVEGAWVLKPKTSEPKAVVHFIGGIFVGAAPQLTYRMFLERLSERGILVIATPYASGFDHFFIADEVQFKFDRCYRFLKETVQDLPTFGIGHSLGSVIHLLIGSRYAVQRNGNVLMAFNNKEASSAVPLFSPVLVPVAQGLGPILSQIASSPTVRFGRRLTSLSLSRARPASDLSLSLELDPPQLSLSRPASASASALSLSSSTRLSSLSLDLPQLSLSLDRAAFSPARSGSGRSPNRHLFLPLLRFLLWVSLSYQSKENLSLVSTPLLFQRLDQRICSRRRNYS